MLWGDLNGQEIQGRGRICVCRAGSLCCAIETKTTVWKPGNTEKILKYIDKMLLYNWKSIDNFLYSIFIENMLSYAF